MGQERFEIDRNRFNLSERLVAEMFLISCIFIFFLGETGSEIPYIWLLISIVGGISSYFIFYSREYSPGFGIGLALGLTVPLFLLEAPLMNILFIFVYVFWRIHANYNGSRIRGWPFITIVNTVVFISMYALARLIFVHNSPEELMQQQMILYLLTSFLFYFIRMVTITINSRQLRNFKVREAVKVFSMIMGLGTSVFFIVLIVLKPAKLLIIETFGFLFGGLFMFFLKAINPILEFFKVRPEEEAVKASEFLFFDFEEREATSSIFEYLSIAFVVAVLVLITVVLIVIVKNKRYNDRQVAYYFSFKGDREHKTEPRKMLYDYSIARDEVRKSFERFEKEAQKYKLNRFPEETVKEWFSRKGWEKNENILSMYNAVRYGSHTPSESEQYNFIDGLENIKKSFFVNK